jgi:hypothetical protein
MYICVFRYDATERISAREAMRHPYFKENREEDARKAQTSSEKPIDPAKTTSIATGGINVQDSGSVTSNYSNKQQAGATITSTTKGGNSNTSQNKGFKLSQEISGLSENPPNKALPNINGGIGNENGITGKQVLRLYGFYSFLYYNN